MIITADQYTRTPVYDLLVAAAKGKIGLDQRVLHAIVDRGEAAVDDLVRFGLEERPDDRINLEEDLVAIFQYIGSPKALPFLVDYLRREPADPAEDLVHAFQRIGPPAIDPLLDLYSELGPKLGSDVAFVLAAFRRRDPRILKLLEERVEHDPADAAFLMGVHGDPAAKPALQKLQEQAASDEALAEKVGNEAAEAFALLDQDREEEALESVSLWELYPEYIEPVFDVMDIDERIEFLNCPSAELRADAATSFIDRDVPAGVERILVRLAAEDPNVGVRAVACTALAGSTDDPEILALLMGKLQDRTKPAPERCGALLAVSATAKGDPELKRYIDEFYANPSTCARAMEAMWRSLDPEYIPVFRRHIHDADIDVRRQAIKGVGFLEMASEAPRLIDLFNDEEFRMDALFSYAMAVPVKKLQRGDMPQLLKKIEELAGGLSEAEGEVLETALDTRLVLHGMEPVFLNFETE
ncbi:MAG TPA: hypothetical protein VM120_18970 [Bryobacteraceae bacterium]|nr:hypothetical protein [Bryobacteraceae bacterium]